MQDSNIKVLRALLAHNENRFCFDCNQRGTTYVNTTIGSFVCTACGGALYCEPTALFEAEVLKENNEIIRKSDQMNVEKNRNQISNNASAGLIVLPTHTPVISSPLSSNSKADKTFVSNGLNAKPVLSSIIDPFSSVRGNVLNNQLNDPFSSVRGNVSNNQLNDPFSSVCGNVLNNQPNDPFSLVRGNVLTNQPNDPFSSVCGNVSNNQPNDPFSLVRRNILANQPKDFFSSIQGNLLTNQYNDPFSSVRGNVSNNQPNDPFSSVRGNVLTNQPNDPFSSVRGNVSNNQLNDPFSSVRGNVSNNQPNDPFSSVRGNVSSNQPNDPFSSVRGNVSNNQPNDPFSSVRGNVSNNQPNDPFSSVRGNVSNNQPNDPFSSVRGNVSNNQPNDPFSSVRGNVLANQFNDPLRSVKGHVLTNQPVPADNIHDPFCSNSSTNQSDNVDLFSNFSFNRQKFTAPQIDTNGLQFSDNTSLSNNFHPNSSAFTVAPGPFTDVNLFPPITQSSSPAAILSNPFYSQILSSSGSNLDIRPGTANLSSSTSHLPTTFSSFNSSDKYAALAELDGLFKDTKLDSAVKPLTTPGSYSQTNQRWLPTAHSMPIHSENPFVVSAVASNGSGAFSDLFVDHFDTIPMPLSMQVASEQPTNTTSKNPFISDELKNVNSNTLDNLVQFSMLNSTNTIGHDSNGFFDYGPVKKTSNADGFDQSQFSTFNLF